MNPKKKQLIVISIVVIVVLFGVVVVAYSALVPNSTKVANLPQKATPNTMRSQSTVKESESKKDGEWLTDTKGDIGDNRSVRSDDKKTTHAPGAKQSHATKQPHVTKPHQHNNTPEAGVKIDTSKPARAEQGASKSVASTPSQPKPKQSTPAPAPSPKPQPTPQPAPVPSLAEQNSQLRASIQSRYGVRVFYGSETSGYQPGGRTTSALSPEDARESLTQLNTVLGKYPAGFFREFSANGVDLSFYMVDRVVQGTTFAGFADSQFMNNIKITLVKGLLMSFTAHHEIMHAIDSYMELKMYPGNPYDAYTALNPTGFQYGSFNKALVQGYAADGAAYFATEYGQTNRREDKAEMFKFMTREGMSASAIFARHPHIMAKAKVIAWQIDAVFHTAGPNEFWTRFLR